MKVFISHSWRDKTIADKLSRHLSAMVDVWLDIQNLRPGDSITPSIDSALAEMDLVIVLWSENAAESDGVAAEITTALRLKKNLIPESRYGVWGFLDDAWLIHNTVYRLAEAGMIDMRQFELDWPKIAAADRIVLSLLPQPVLQQLSASMMQYLNFLAVENSGYNPGFSSSGSAYHPFWPQDPAEQEGQVTIDDIISMTGSGATIWHQ